MSGQPSAVAVAHAVPGRARLRVDAVRGDAHLARDVEKRLAAVDGVTGVHANATTGSVVVHLARRHASWLDDVGAIVQGLAPIVAHRDSEHAIADFRRRHAGHRRHPRHGVTSFFRDVNAGVASSVGGVDLTLLLPAALVVLGLGSFVSSERTALPRWYELIWFGFGTFMMLNAAGVPGAKAAEEAAELAATL